MTDHQTSPVGEDAERAGSGISDAEIAGIMGWRGPGAYTEASLRKIKRVLQEDRARRAAPTQPKAQGSIDTPEFAQVLGDLIDEVMAGRLGQSYERARAALIAHIDAWAGSRAGDAVPTWIRVTDALPPSGKRVLVTRFAGRVNGPEHPGYPGVPWIEVSHVYDNVGFMCDLCSTGNVTHWAEIEAAPAPGKQAGNDQEDA